MAQPPKGGLVRGHDKPIHGSCAIYFPGGISIFDYKLHSQYYHKPSKPSDPVFESLVSNSLLDDDYT